MFIIPDLLPLVRTTVARIAIHDLIIPDKLCGLINIVDISGRTCDGVDIAASGIPQGELSCHDTIGYLF